MVLWEEMPWKQLFFDKMPQVLPIYQAFEERILKECAYIEIQVKKTQISFKNKYNFAFVSLPVRRRKGWPEICIIVTFGLSHRLESRRIMQAVEPYPNRWTHHVIVEDVDEIDQELMGWIREAYEFALLK